MKLLVVLTFFGTLISGEFRNFGNKAEGKFIGQSLVNLFAPSIVDFIFTGVLNRLENIPQYENFTSLPELIDDISDKTGNELIDILEHPSLPEMKEPDNWSVKEFGRILQVDEDVLDGAVDEVMSLVPGKI